VSLTDSLECQDAALLESLSQCTLLYDQKEFLMKFSHQIHMLSHNIIISCQTYEIQFQIPHYTCTTSFIMPLRSKTVNHGREQVIKTHICTGLAQARNLHLSDIGYLAYAKHSRLSKSSNSGTVSFLRVLA